MSHLDKSEMWVKQNKVTLKQTNRNRGKHANQKYNTYSLSKILLRDFGHKVGILKNFEHTSKIKKTRSFGTIFCQDFHFGGKSNKKKTICGHNFYSFLFSRVFARFKRLCLKMFVFFCIFEKIGKTINQVVYFSVKNIENSFFGKIFLKEFSRPP